MVKVGQANGWRYPLVGGTRQRHFIGSNSKPRKLPENAPTPTTPAPAYFAGDRVHAVLGGVLFNHELKVSRCFIEFHGKTHRNAYLPKCIPSAMNTDKILHWCGQEM